MLLLYYSINKMVTVLLELRRPESIMLENLPKMLLGISPIMLGLFPINMLKYANSKLIIAVSYVYTHN